uniref:Uncharacterized protein n=1 Tax=Physcomitrium patens TaxID=3218 RepID=A0A2K1IM84_PHYPA|nr:hypothetical protein PHYPA_026705 [Physcomitrium patens]
MCAQFRQFNILDEIRPHLRSGSHLDDEHRERGWSMLVERFTCK